MRASLVVVVIGLFGCAGSQPHAEHVAPPPAAPAGESGGEAMGGGGSEASGPEQQPEVVHAGKSFRISWADAQARYGKGARCGGADAPDQVIGEPDQHNSMQVAHDQIETWGFRFREGTLMIRCRRDHVEALRTLK